MIGNLFTVAELDPESLRRALADMLALPDGAVDVADADGDQEDRRWDAPVLCTFRVLPPGDLAMELDITVEDATAGTLTEERLALGLAARVKSSVLHPSELDLPSAYWVAVQDGRSVRCRLEAVDTDEDTAYRVDAVEEQVPDLPRARVEVLPEILDRQPISTPVSDAFLATLPTGTAASIEGRVHYALRVWERLTRRLQSDWAPSGRYREDLFRRDLEARDALELLISQVDEAYADALRDTVTRLDRIFSDCTDTNPTGDSGKAARWWWNRLPLRTPW
ncbi:hypothetical protein [Streptomyces swartbergensis]|uniref:Uncharacterized protein n=1 Tax=Streptomyces swartbergensis TaxID=487165 RepID=A0A243S097_9ACTN|nr:hypothetical protein [Streptomyces swartbergensis]OUD00883.1 hypothetical protein CA983_23090 [Streptomyces swartbergensis]